MKKYLKYSLFALAAILLCGGALLAYVAATVNPNDYKPQIVKLVKEKKDRNLALPGDIKLQFFPRLGLDLGRASLSEKGGQGEFARIDSLKLYVAWLPLLHKSLEVDRISASGVAANLVRYPDGKTNIDDLLGQGDGGSGGSFDIQGVTLDNSAFVFDDRINRRKIAVKNIVLKTGRLKEGVQGEADLGCDLEMDNPKLHTHLTLHSGYLFAKDGFSLDGMDLAANGDAFGLSNLDFKLQGGVSALAGSYSASKLSLDLKGNHAGDAVSLKLAAPQFSYSQQKIAGEKISLAASLMQEKNAINLSLTVPLIEGSGSAFRAPGISLSLGGGMQAQLSGDLAGNLDANPQNLAAKLAGKIDESNIAATVSLRDFSAPEYRFDAKIDRIDFDRYLGKDTAPSAPEQPFDLSALKTLKAAGSLHIGELKVKNIKAANFDMQAKAAQGKLDLNPLSATLYQGSLNGNVSVDARKNLFAAREKLRGISIGPLIRDALARDILEGKGDLAFDLTASGDRLSVLKKHLNGSASLNLADGAVKGINIAATLRNLKAKVGATSGTQAANSAEKTDFASLSASFRIREGVAHNDDLAMKSPLLRLGGKGDIDLGQSSMDYLAKVTVVGTLQGQGGPELAALRGITVPIRLSGPFDSLKYSVDMGALLQGAVKGKVEQKKEELQQKLQQQLKGGLPGIFGR